MRKCSSYRVRTNIWNWK